MKFIKFSLGAALIAVLAWCVMPVKPDLERQQELERELGRAARARYWAIQDTQKPSLPKS